MKKTPSFREIKTLSAYLDGELGASARRKTEARLARDPNLRAALDDLRATRAVLRRAPQHRAPRNFVLSGQMVAQRPPTPRLVPALNYASAFALLLLLFSFFSPSDTLPRTATPAPNAVALMQDEAAAAEETVLEAAAADETVPDAAAADETAPEAFVAEEAAPAAAVTASVAEPLEKETLAQADATLPASGATLVATPAVEEEKTAFSDFSLSLWQTLLLAAVLLLPVLAYFLRLRTQKKWREKFS
jgi:anti-sigma factor RsiW